MLIFGYTYKINTTSVEVRFEIGWLLNGWGYEHISLDFSLSPSDLFKN